MIRASLVLSLVVLLGCGDDADGPSEDAGPGDGGAPVDAFSVEDAGQPDGGADTDGGPAEDAGTLPCGIDCSTIETMPCQEATCDEADGRCVIVDAADGVSCDDELFCTVDDRCESGECVGGGTNDCGMTPAECQQISCDEESSSCGTSPQPDGTECVSENLCLSDTTCTDGVCGGGTETDCFFAPVPNECHVAICNPDTGDCEARPDADANGQPCTDPTDLCSVENTCDSGSCTGGTTKDCSVLDDPSACERGACNPTNGFCTTESIDTCSLTSDGCCPTGCTAGDDADC